VIGDNSDASWEKWGKEDPYYGVLTHDKFRRENLDDDLKGEFFETGRVHVERVMAMTLRHCGPKIVSGTALDFGCGVGRLVIPLAHLFEHVTAVDVSSAMLGVAERNCLEQGIKNVEFVRSDDKLSRIVGKFDFIHSYLVLQHIPIRRGERIIAQLLERLNDDGVLAIHFPFLRNDSVIKRFVHRLRKNLSPVSVLANIVLRKPWNTPFIQMNTYDLNRVSVLLSDHGIKDVAMEVVDAGGFVSAFVIAKKTAGQAGKVQGQHLWAAKFEA
jgi:2-polyprenyl-3-methyl-5-hydroxy-6-metoxy-1,4-benzoquinol methylase